MFLKLKQLKVIKVSIKTKVIFSFCLLIVLMLIGQIIFNIYFSKEFFLAENKNDLESLFNEIKTSYSDDPEMLSALTEEGDLINGFSIQIFSDESMIYTSRNSPNIVQGIRFDKIVIQSLLKELEFSQIPVAKEMPSNDEQRQMLFISGMFEYNDESRYVIISKQVKSIDESISVFTRSSIYISIIILLVGIVVIFILARQISKPIYNIEKVSKKLSDLDFSYYANEKSSIKELSSLAISINSMSLQLEKNMTDLQKANVKLVEDIEYQKKLEANRKQFIANISHEMKTPLALLQLYSENLLSDIAEIDRDEYVNIIIEETLRLDLIVKDMLNISSVENGLAKVRKEVFNLSDSVKNFTSNMLPLLSDFDITIDIEPQIEVFADQKQIEEAMRNYINNAISHTENGKKIVVSLKKSYHDVIFSVYNEGERIEHEDIENIWESFYKSDKARTRNSSSNAGLGLYIVRLVCENHEGKYKVENKESGVEFSLALTITS